MIVGTGVDITEVLRIKAAVARFGDRFLRRVFTSAEAAYCLAKPNAAERLAARFAAKEAALKAIGTGLRHGITWRDVEVVRVPGQRPTISFHGKAAQFADRLGSKRAHLSLSHTAEHAIAYVILESD
ncbi:MAG TPA: holo-ACP synthase [Candidatus Angelobacter sp.]|nr:holo-ACP synthase [Candidatus Angelobacter sp.]